jgi:hypothetical protein
MTMQCLEFRRAAGADPRHLDAAVREHSDTCPKCAEFLRQTLALDERILAALRVAVPEGAGPASASKVVALPLLDRRRWMALAASIAGGVLVGTLLWVSGPRASLAEDVVRHMAHEPGVMVQTSAPADPAKLERVLDRGGIRLDPDVGLVSYAETCRFRGRKVPHLVVQTDAGPATVMVLPHESVAAPVQFDEGGYSGTILPAGSGSIAVLGHEPQEVIDQVAERVAAAVEWK